MQEKAWWKESVVYQIYPRSFMDSNGDGVGDLAGITSRLDYLKELGVDVLWLSPIYRSPNDDNGYDISDYRAIMDEFGTMADFDRLLEGAHARGLKIMLDLVVNHTSDEHAWFLESKKGADSPYRDYYIWRKGKEGGPPNNWGSVFSGPAWEYDAGSDAYYLHLFSKKQPDLNWENPQVRDEVFGLMDFWLQKGIDGFRMDVINMISKVPGLPDGEKHGGLYGDATPFVNNGPRVHEYLQEMNRRVLSRYDVMTVGETPGATVEDALRYTGFERGELNMVFQFEHMGLDSGPEGKWGDARVSLPALKRVMSKWQQGLDGKGWNSLYWNNHDQPRVVSRFGDDGEYRARSAKMLGTCLHMMQGTPYIYQGEELGMTNVPFASIEEYRDIESLNAYREWVGQRGTAPADMLRWLQRKSRDNARTPMQWSAAPHAGFTTATPWIKVNPNYPAINAESQLHDEGSVFAYYKRLIALRKQYPVVVYGDYRLLLLEDEQLYAYTRTLEGETLLVLCNFSAQPAAFTMPQELRQREKALLISNCEDIAAADEMRLQPYESCVFLCK